MTNHRSLKKPEQALPYTPDKEMRLPIFLKILHNISTGGNNQTWTNLHQICEMKVGKNALFSNILQVKDK